MLKYKTPTIAINDHEGRCLGQQACLYEQGEDDDDHDGDDDLYYNLFISDKWICVFLFW
jgi:hypothetical protein